MLENLPDVLGHALRNQRAGLDKIAFQRVGLRSGQASIAVGSLAFIDHGPIPELYTADGEGISPPLHWTGIPPNATSLIVIVEDADSPTPNPLVHGIAVELPGADGSLAQGAFDTDKEEQSQLRPGRNSLLQTGWLPPDPPPGHGPHRYAFQVFALTQAAEWSETPGRDEVIRNLAEHAIASGCLIGTYERHDTTVRSDEPSSVPLAPAG